MTFEEWFGVLLDRVGPPGPPDYYEGFDEDNLKECWQEATKQEQERNSAEVARLREALEMVEWVGVADGYVPHNVCPWCDGTDYDGHLEGCDRQAALSDTADGMED